MCNQLFLVLLLLFFSTSFFAQNNSYVITGVVSDSISKTPIQYCTVYLKGIYDSTLIYGVITDENGEYRISNIKKGEYYQNFSFIGYSSKMKIINVYENKQGVNVCLNENSEILKEVEIAEKVIERKIDKLVMNTALIQLPENSTALDLIKRVPGAVTTFDNNFTIIGKPVLVLIDGRPVRMAIEQVMQMLKNQSNYDILKIEIMLNPPPKYVDEWEGAVINIITSKNLTNGYYGSIGNTLGYGKHVIDELTFDFYYRWTSVFTFISLNFKSQTKEHEHKLSQFLVSENKPSLFQTTNEINKLNNCFLTTGINYNINKINTIDLNYQNSLFKNILITKDSVLDYKIADNNIFTFNQSNNSWKNHEINFFYRNSIDSFSVFDIELDYSIFNDTYNQDRETKNINLSNIVNDRNMTPGNTKIKYIKSTYTFENSKYRLESGLKYNLTSRKNDFTYENLINNQWLNDTSKSNTFLFNEDIIMLYLSLGQQINDQFSYLFSLRNFYTKQQGHSKTLNQESVKEYFNFLPSVFLSYRLNDKHDFSLSHNTTLERPTYNTINPFKYYTNPFNYIQGNENLTPSIKNKIELIHNFKEKIFTSIYYENIRDNIILTPIINYSNSEINGYQYDNFLKIDNYVFSVNYSLSFIKERLNFNLQPVFKLNKLTDKNNLLNNDFNNFDFDIMIDYLINKKINWNIGVYNSYTTGLVWQYYEIKNFNKCGISTGCSFLNNTLDVYFEVNDIFNAEKNSYSYIINNIKSSNYSNKDSRYFRLSIYYSFSSNFVKQKYARGIDNSEKNRIK